MIRVKNNKQRVRDMRQRRHEAGWRELTLWAHVDDWPRIRAFAEKQATARGGLPDFSVEVVTPDHAIAHYAELQAGKSVKEVAKAAGVSHHTIYTRLRAAGLSPKKVEK